MLGGHGITAAPITSFDGIGTVEFRGTFWYLNATSTAVLARITNDDA